MSEVKKQRAILPDGAFVKFEIVVSEADFDAQRLRADTAEAERDALRYKAELYDEVWADATGRGYANVTMALCALAAAEQRIAKLEDLLRRAKPYIPWSRFGTVQYQWNLEVQDTLNPNPEAESHEC